MLSRFPPHTTQHTIGILTSKGSQILSVKALQHLTNTLKVAKFAEGLENYNTLTAVSKKPDILIGTDYFWKLLLCDDFHVRSLSSGYQLIHSSIGDIITGKPLPSQKSIELCYNSTLPNGEKKDQESTQRTALKPQSEKTRSAEDASAPPPDAKMKERERSVHNMALPPPLAREPDQMKTAGEFRKAAPAPAAPQAQVAPAPAPTVLEPTKESGQIYGIQLERPQPCVPVQQPPVQPQPQAAPQSYYSPKENDIVLIQDKNLERGQWQMGKIVSSSDEYLRSAQVMLPSKKIITRPINMLCKLEIDNDNIADKEDNGEETEHKPSLPTPGNRGHPMTTRSKARATTLTTPFSMFTIVALCFTLCEPSRPPSRFYTQNIPCMTIGNTENLDIMEVLHEKCDYSCKFQTTCPTIICVNHRDPYIKISTYVIITVPLPGITTSIYPKRYLVRLQQAPRQTHSYNCPQHLLFRNKLLCNPIRWTASRRSVETVSTNFIGCCYCPSEKRTNVSMKVLHLPYTRRRNYDRSNMQPASADLNDNSKMYQKLHEFDTSKTSKKSTMEIERLSPHTSYIIQQIVRSITRNQLT
ncbi:unnamed protein product [Nippostrongylus brasiliensis]|uniref:DUF1758 domain-containing protein n=1 Tax=Nippostrongylus brasiliensis TaxID=27835 RepID=A0A0N4XGG5_NIPBR|nr:unnamed protein product [Nippostrongylus brasiliensis]